MEHLSALPAGTRLADYEIEGVLGAGGFGITYRAVDVNLHKVVALKEYLPRDFATRTSTRTVVPTSSADTQDYEWGLRRFVDEGRTLGRFDHPNLNKVHRYIEAHGTAYLVLEYLEGETLGAVLQREGTLSQARVERLLSEVLSGLEEVHAADYVHRDIKPDNLMVRPDGSVVVLDFGAARQAVGQRSKSITSILTPGYAPIEQYDPTAADVGAWSDLYALGMVAYRSISGLKDGELPDAVTRSRAQRKGSGELEPAASIGQGRYDARFLRAIDWAIQVEEDARPQSIAAWQQALPELGPSEGRAVASSVPGPEPPPTTTADTGAFPRWATVVGVLALVAAVAGGAYWYARQQGILTEPNEVATKPPVTEPGRAESPAPPESQPVEPTPEPQQTASVETGTGTGIETEEPVGPAAEPSPEEVEAGLELARAERLLVQHGLREAGQEPGPADGLFGGESARTRQAIRAWQTAKDMEASGYLTREQADTLIELGRARADDAAYAEAERADMAAGYGAYVRAYPSGRHVQEARASQQRLQAQAEQQRAAEARFGRLLQMVRVPGGTFMMGCTREQSECRDTEKPAHQVRMSAFELSQYEVTQELWAAVMGTNPSYFKNCAQCPVEQVSWDDVQAFLRNLNAGGGRYRLPSEAEWEYAARGGQASRGYEYAGSNTPSSVGWSEDNSGNTPHPVGQKQPNELGLYDLSGNVWEWVQDCWHASYNGAPSDGQAWERGECRRRVLRGGSWVSYPGDLRAANRDRDTTDNRYISSGFRVARSLP